MLVPVSKNNDQLSFTRQINSVFSYDVHMQTLKSRNALLLRAMPRLSCTLSTTDRRSDVDWKATCTWVCMSCNCLYSLYLTFLHVVINVVSDTQHPCHQATEVLSYGGRHTWDSAPWDEPWTMQSCSPLVGRGESLSLNPDQNETQQQWVHNLYKILTI